jgi:hypothetical protein
VRVLPDWDFGSMEVNALFVNGKTIKPAARAFADFLLRELRAAGLDAQRPPSENERAGARYQGRAIAETAAKLQG